MAAWNLYRAATQSIAGDEALTYLWFLRDSWRDVLTRFNANNHVLYSLLAKASLSLFGHSEFALRLPALLAGWLYLAAAYRVSLRLVAGFLPWAATLAALCLNPLVLDFLSCARGYGPAIAALLWAIDEMLRERESGRLRPVRLGLWCGAAICANLTAATAVAAILAVLGVHRLIARRSLLPVLAAFTVAARASAALLWAPLSRASRSDFYAGSQTVASAVASLIASFAPAPSHAAWLWALALLLALAALGAALHLRRPQAAPAQVLLLCLVALYAGHRWFQIPLPLNRTGLYLIPLFTLAVAGCRELLGRSRPALAAKFLISLAAVACLALYLTHLRADRYFVWIQDAATRRALASIRRLADQRQLARPVRIASTIWLYPSLEYYALQQGGWFVNRTIRNGCEPYPFYFAIPPSGPPDPPSSLQDSSMPRYDFYLLWTPDLPFRGNCGLTDLEHYEESGTVLAAPMPYPATRP
ncbi:MAG: glycosyltransferase family 39 protein [Bryobacteraceae bacterium]|nr:glycosyltransferase family 39 protein [Bryobacteraceae bacterium]